MNKRIFLFCVSFCLVSSLAVANPIMMDGRHGLQVPESMHVQISYYCGGMGEDMDSEFCHGPVDVTRDGSSLGLEFEGPTGITVNGGSGLDTYYALQVCDCDVPVGTYEYKLVFDGGDGWLAETMMIIVTDPPPEPGKEEPMPEGDVMPWDIPSGPWPKGLDCVEWCQNKPDPGEDTAPVADPGPVLTQDTAPQPGQDTGTIAADIPGGENPGPGEETVEEAEGSCSVSGQGGLAGFLTLLLLLGLAVRFVPVRVRND